MLPVVCSSCCGLMSSRNNFSRVFYNFAVISLDLSFFRSIFLLSLVGRGRGGYIYIKKKKNIFKNIIIHPILPSPTYTPLYLHPLHRKFFFFRISKSMLKIHRKSLQTTYADFHIEKCTVIVAKNVENLWYCAKNQSFVEFASEYALM
jgi:hypothetical protein